MTRRHRGRSDRRAGVDDAVVRFGGVPYARRRAVAAARADHVDRAVRRHPPGRRATADRRRPRPRARDDPRRAERGRASPPRSAPRPSREPRRRRPVLVWVPGGSYRVGGASLPLYDGAHLAAHDVVVVGLNYRLGALGWLATDGVPSNLPLRDLRAAVDWLRDNVAAFGGDPDRIVLMGESAGSGAIAHLLAAYPDLPVARRHPPERRARGHARRRRRGVGGRHLPRRRGCVVDRRRCATRRSTRLLAAQDQTVADALAKVGMMPFHPWVDGDVLTGRAHESPLPAIPLVVGTTAHEMELFRDQVPVLPARHRGAVPRGQGRQPRHHRRRRACAPRSAPRATTWWRRWPTSSCTCPTRSSPAATRRAATRCTATGSCGRHPCGGRATRSTCRSRSAPST